jgi:hypothetical protein
MWASRHQLDAPEINAGRVLFNLKRTKFNLFESEPRSIAVPFGGNGVHGPKKGEQGTYGWAQPKFLYRTDPVQHYSPLFFELATPHRNRLLSRFINKIQHG